MVGTAVGVNLFLGGLCPIKLACSSAWNISGVKSSKQRTLSLLNWIDPSFHPFPILWNHFVTCSFSDLYLSGPLLNLSGPYC